VRTTIFCNSRLVSVNFSCAILDHFINSFGIIINADALQKRLSHRILC